MEGDLHPSLKMADVFLGKDFQAQTFPFRQPVAFDVSANSAVPWGQAIVNESWESQAIGAGDTGTMSIDIELPSDYVSILRQFHIQATSSNAVNWVDGVMGLAYQQPGGPYKTSVATFPEDEYLYWDLIRTDVLTYRDRFASAKILRRFIIAQGDPSKSVVPVGAVDSPAQIPLWIPPQTDTSLQSRSVIAYLKNDSGSSSANDFVLNAVFDLYTLEQAYAAGVMSSPRIF